MAALAEAPLEAADLALDAVAGADERWTAYRDVRDRIREIAAHPDWRDHPLTLELLDAVFELEARLEADPRGEDPEWRVREAVDRLRDLLATIEREVEHGHLDDPAVAARYVLATLAGVDRATVASVLGVDARTLRTWQREVPRQMRRDNQARVVLVAQLVYELTRSMGPGAIGRWFAREQPRLGGRSPQALIAADPGRAQEVLRPLARGLRGQLAA
jgi:hypothetical protein